jgi:hypothetical protein
MNSISAKCGHVKRRLSRGEPLTGKLLEFALDVIGEGTGNSRHDAFFDVIAAKLKDGTQLSEYEFHMFVEVVLLHVRLGAAR